MHKMLEFDDAIQCIRDNTTTFGEERVPIDRALGRFLAQPLVAPENLPSFTNSAMDGFSISVGTHSTIAAGSVFPITASVAAGESSSVEAQGACEIMTGARLPSGHDSVIMVENTEIIPGPGSISSVRFLTAVQRGQNVRLPGEDIEKGRTILRAGKRIESAAQATLSALGITSVLVTKKLRIGIICTGSEIATGARNLAVDGHIRDSNGPFLRGYLTRADIEIHGPEIVPDRADLFLSSVDQMVSAGCNVIVSTGAVSMGRYDFVPDALVEYGATPIFHKVRMRPGKPLFYARKEDIHFIGLPGNPASTAAGARFFLEPMIRRLRGQEDEVYRRVELASAVNKRVDFTVLLKATLDRKESVARAGVLDGQESFKISPLMVSDGWIIAPSGRDEIGADELVEFADIYPM